METQEESVDFSYLKNMTLGHTDESSLQQISVPEHNNPSRREPEAKAQTINTVREDTECQKRNLFPLATAPCQPSSGRPHHEQLNYTSRNDHTPFSSPTKKERPPLKALVSTPQNMDLQNSPVGGDTQPLSPSVYESFSKRSKEQSNLSLDGSTRENDATPRPLLESDTDHVDLLVSFKQSGVDDDKDVEDGAEEEDLIETDETHMKSFAESKHFTPKTPATIGKKRNYLGEEVGSNKTPSLPTNPFGRNLATPAGIMAMSQVFATTQALTSPVSDALHSDMVYERPSPNVQLNGPSPLGPSSPSVNFLDSELKRGYTEPQATYVPMKDSQKKRARALQRSLSTNRLVAEDSSDDDFLDDETYNRRRRQREKTENARKALFGVTGPQRILSPRTKRSARQPVSSPKPPSSILKPNSQFSPDTPIFNDSRDIYQEENPTEDETEQEEDAEEIVQNDLTAEEDKENIDTGIQVPMTTGRSIKPRPLDQSLHSSPLSRHQRRYSEGDNGRPSVGLHTESVHPSGTTNASENLSSLEANQNRSSASQAIAIKDSQPSQSRADEKSTQDTIILRTPALASSLPPDFFVPQSQSGEFPENNQSRPCPVNIDLEVDSSPLAKPPLLSSSQPVRTPTSGRTLRPFVPLEEKEKTQERLKLPQIENRSLIYEENNSSHVQTYQNVTGGKDKVMIAQNYTNPPKPGHNTPKSIEYTGSQPDTPEGAFKNMNNERTDIYKPLTIPETSSIDRVTRFLSSEQEDTDSIHHAEVEKSDWRTAEQSKSASKNETAIMDGATKFSSKSKQLGVLETSPAKPKTPTRRTLLEILSSPTPQTSLRQYDIDINIMTNDDREFEAAIQGSSPPLPVKKRRRGTHGPVIIDDDIEYESSGKLVPKTNQHPPTLVEHSPLTPSHIEIRVPDKLSTTRTERVNIYEPPASVKKPSVIKRLQLSRPTPFEPSRSHGKLGRPKKSLNQYSCGNTEQEDPIQASPKTTPDVPRGSVKRRGRPPHSHKVPVTQSSPKQPQISQAHSRSSRTSDDPPSEMLVPNRVFAFFNDQRGAFHPGTCVGITLREGEEPRFKVRFDDGTIDDCDESGISRLELHPGDSVKIDSPGIPKQICIVIRLQNSVLGNAEQEPAAHPKFPKTDIHGFSAVLLASKKDVQDISNVPSDKTFTIPLTSLYIPRGNWSHFRNRKYRFDLPESKPTPRTRTPLPATPRSPISHTRGRRVTSSKLTNRLRSVSSSPDALSSSIFSGMVFAISIRDEEKLGGKDKIARLLTSNGGTVKDGFDELFHVPSLESASPSKHNIQKGPATLNLAHDAKDYGFTCLLADKYSRIVKYMQALALGLPCIAIRWVDDCISYSKILRWDPYLLPSGESSFLGGAVRSRVLQTYSAVDAKLSAVINNRPKLLGDKSVMLIMGKGRTEEGRKAYLFFAHALGASMVARVNDLEAAKKALQESQNDGRVWDFIYAGEKNNDVQQAVQYLFGDENGDRKSKTGRKRKRGPSSVPALNFNGDGKTKVVGSEFVLQSLIAGQLLEEN
ncbi:MAG: hypothetical protein M1834_005158 [Cirrosporium novae-zelandiae]|nr:MAG: hypothetical protein M1834_005158 [Cirrosporium novae-zelandiae]